MPAQVRSIVPILGGLCLFTVGLAIGQQRESNKVAKLEERFMISQAQWGTLNASLELIRTEVPYDSRGTGVIRLYYDPNTKKIKGTALVRSKLLEKETAEELRNSLMFKSHFALVTVQAWLPEISEKDFEVAFNDLWRDPPLFAEYKDGKLILH